MKQFAIAINGSIIAGTVTNDGGSCWSRFFDIEGMGHFLAGGIEEAKKAGYDRVEVEVVLHDKPSNKGKFNGICNRTVCFNHPAIYYNSSTRAYYCKPCARAINKANGVKLCVLKESE